VLARNLRVGADEIDLLVAWGSLLVAVEVKTLVGRDPAEEFTPAKVDRFRRAGLSLLPTPARFDLVTVCVRRAGVGLRWLPGVC
jgi:Holliday junction resolvase-like predicted endonuclease